MFRYKLADVKENEGHISRGINGYMLDKTTWFLSQNRIQKLEAFKEILDIQEFDELAELKAKAVANHEEIQKVVEERRNLKAPLAPEDQLRKDINEMTKSKIVEAIIEYDSENYSKESFKGASLDDLKETLYSIRKKFA